MTDFAFIFETWSRDVLFTLLLSTYDAYSTLATLGLYLIDFFLHDLKQSHLISVGIGCVTFNGARYALWLI